MTNEEVNDLYEQIREVEKQQVQVLDAFLTDVSTTLAAIKQNMPEEGINSVPQQFYNRIYQALQPVMTYELDTIKRTYGLTPPITTPVMTTPMPV